MQQVCTDALLFSSGHYLNDRRATQDQRIFKYASRGYGIRFLPAYVEAVKGVEPQDGEATDEAKLGNEKAEAGESQTGQAPVDEPQSLLHLLLTDARNRIDWFSDSKEDLSHAHIHGAAMMDPDVARGCLANFKQFARHVALEELNLEGVVEIRHTFADSYEEDPQSYYDGPE